MSRVLSLSLAVPDARITSLLQDLMGARLLIWREVVGEEPPELLQPQRFRHQKELDETSAFVVRRAADAILFFGGQGSHTLLPLLGRVERHPLAGL